MINKPRMFKFLITNKYQILLFKINNKINQLSFN